jgi:hypothetical protein
MCTFAHRPLDQIVSPNVIPVIYDLVMVAHILYMRMSKENALN